MTSFTLKIIAVISMFIDHADKVFNTQFLLMQYTDLDIKTTYKLAELTSDIGRIALPIFAFFIAEGCRNTRNIKRYIIRLLIFGLISEIPYQLAFRQAAPLEFEFTNVLFTLALGSISIYLYKILKENKKPFLICVIPCLICMLLAEIGSTDYMWWGVLLIFISFILPTRKTQLFGMFVILTGLYMGYDAYSSSGFAWMDTHTAIYSILKWLFALIPLLLLWKYNGKRGHNIKWFFYWFYPVHLAVLVIIREFT